MTGRKRGNAPGDGGARNKKGQITGREEMTLRQQALAAELKNGMRLMAAGKAVGYSGSVATSAAFASKSFQKTARAGRNLQRERGRSLAVYLSLQVMSGRVQVSPAQVKMIEWYLNDLKSEDAEKDSLSKPLREMTHAELVALGAKAEQAKQLPIVPIMDGEAVEMPINTASTSP